MVWSQKVAFKLYPKNVKTYTRDGTEGAFWAEKTSRAKAMIKPVMFWEMKGPLWLEWSGQWENIT